jgi:hypothetical protein
MSKNTKIDDDLLKGFHEWEEKHENWRNAPYDGLLGSVPHWVPSSFHFELEHSRGLLLETWGLSVDEAMKWINFFETADHEAIAILDRDSPFPSGFPTGYPFDPIHFYRTCTKLSQLRWASQLSPEDGLYRLAGEYAARGYKNAKNLKTKKPNNLSILINHTYSRIHKLTSSPPSWRRVLNSLERYDLPQDPILEYIDWDFEYVRWRNLKGQPRETSFGQFRNKITEAKKQFQGSGKT